MAQIQPIIKAEIDPSNPVPEICSIIMAVTAFNQGHEEAILQGVIEAAQKRLAMLKGAEGSGKPVLQSKRQ